LIQIVDLHQARLTCVNLGSPVVNVELRHFVSAGVPRDSVGVIFDLFI